MKIIDGETRFDVTDELAHNAGVPRVYVELRGKRYPLMPLKIADTIRIEEEVGPLLESGNSQRGIIWQLYLAMVRGGMPADELTPADLAEELEAAQLPEVVAKLNALVPGFGIGAEGGEPGNV